MIRDLAFLLLFRAEFSGSADVVNVRLVPRYGWLARRMGYRG